MNRKFLALLLSLGLTNATGTETVKFWIEAPDTLEFGKSVTVTYHLHTNDFRDVEWPQFTCFKLDTYYFPSYDSYFNKTRFRDFEWKMVVSPLKSGLQTLPSMSVMANGQKVNTEEKSIFVKGKGDARDALMLKAVQAYWSSKEKVYEPVYRPKPTTLVNDFEAEVAKKRLKEKGQMADNIWLKAVTSNAELVLLSDDWNTCFAIVARKKYEGLMEDLILAYSTESSVENHATLVKYYTDELKSLAGTGGQKQDWGYKPKDKSVSPLLGETHWGQEAPFNGLMPVGNDGNHIPTGAGAVALAQVMRYHQYPVQGKGKHFYQVSKDDTYGMNFSRQSFDWEKTKDEYGEVETDSNVARIVSACAYALETQSPAPKKTRCTHIRNFKAALVNYFGYDTRCALVENVTSNLTVSFLRSEIDARRPVVCEGMNNYFVVDGYEGDFFHLNMGWRSYFNGYYRLALSSDDENSSPLVEAMLVGVEPSKGDSLKKEVTLNKPGMLSEILTDDEKNSITYLKVTGKLDANDMKLIREMAGAVDMTSLDVRPGRLSHLDLEDATFVTDKNTPYMQNDASGYTYTETSYMQYGSYGRQFVTGTKSVNMSDVSHDEWKKLRRKRVFKGKGYAVKENADSKLMIDFTLKKGLVTPYLFANCDNLQYILLPDNTKGIEDAAFAFCNSLKYIVLPPNVETVSEGSFMLCYNLRNVYYLSRCPSVKKGIHGVLNVSSEDRIKGICIGAFAGNNSATCKEFQKAK